MEDDEPFEFNNVPHTKEQTWELFSVRKTILEMLKDRGYNLPVEDDENITVAGYRSRFHGKVDKDLTILVQKIADFDQKMMIFFPSPPPEATTRRVGAEAVKHIHEKMNAESVRRAIIIVERPLMGHANVLIEVKTEEQHELGNLDWRVEVFLRSELVVNITRHELVPKHVVMTDQDKKTLLKRYHLQEKHLPRIQKSDPISRYFGLQHRQVLKIIRPSETAGYYVTYRLVA